MVFIQFVEGNAGLLYSLVGRLRTEGLLAYGSKSWNDMASAFRAARDTNSIDQAGALTSGDK